MQPRLPGGSWRVSVPGSVRACPRLPVGITRRGYRDQGPERGVPRRGQRHEHSRSGCGRLLVAAPDPRVVVHSPLFRGQQHGLSLLYRIQRRGRPHVHGEQLLLRVWFADRLDVDDEPLRQRPALGQQAVRESRGAVLQRALIGSATSSPLRRATGTSRSDCAWTSLRLRTRTCRLRWWNYMCDERVCMWGDGAISILNIVSTCIIVPADKYTCLYRHKSPLMCI